MSDPRDRENRVMSWKLGAIALGAFGFGFALVPLYRMLCAVTGYGDQRKLARARHCHRAPGPEPHRDGASS